MEKQTSFREVLLSTALDLDKSMTSKDSATLRILMEENRFQQDCRKRALDLAAGEYAEWYRSRNSPKSLAPTGEETPPNIIEVADKYYQWLISIPNDK